MLNTNDKPKNKWNTDHKKENNVKMSALQLWAFEILIDGQDCKAKVKRHLNKFIITMIYQTKFNYLEKPEGY